MKYDEDKWYKRLMTKIQKTIDQEKIDSRHRDKTYLKKSFD